MTIRRSRFPRGKAILLAALIIIVIIGCIGLLLPGIREPLTAFIFPSHTPSTTYMAGLAVDAPMFGFNPQHTHFNPDEHILTPATVSHLVPDWVSSATGGSLFSSPVIVDGIVYTGSLDGKLYAFNAAGCGKATCSPLWSGATGGRIFASPAVSGGVVYITSYDHRLYAFEAGGCGQTTCVPLWISTPTGDTIDSSPVVVGGMIYTGSNDHRLYAFKADGCGEPTCAPLWVSTATGDMLTSTPAVANGVVYIGSDDNKLYAFKAGGCGKPTCSPLWTSTPAAYAFEASPAVTNGMVYIGSDDGKVYVFNAGGCGKLTCDPLWTAALASIIDSSPAVANGVVYVGSWDHKLYAFNANGCGQSTCSPLWASTPTGSIIDSSPTIAGGVVYIGSQDGHVYAFNAAGCGQSICSPLWASPFAGDGVFSSPAVVKGTVYVSSLDHRLYAYHLAPAATQVSSQLGYGIIDSIVPTTGCGRASPVKTGTSVDMSMPVSPAEANGFPIRTYRIHVPTSYNPERPIPLVLVFHGAFGNAAGMERGTGFSQVAEQHNFIVVYPQGLVYPLTHGTFWASIGPRDFGIDDVLFVSNLLNDLQQKFCINAHAIFATGFSNGGGMVGFLACKLAGRIAAFAPVSGNFYAFPGGCHPGRPVPILYFHGSKETGIPYNGIPASENPAWPLPAIPQWLQDWASRDGCTSGPTVFLQIPRAMGEQWTNCQRNAAIVHYLIIGGGHAWPPTIQGRSGSELIWDFFQNHLLLTTS